ncbi:MAG TPA: DUF1385 domain-containing protein [Candidatus Acidoferrales bacterium]|nr:DUF1385 domain-containing protein [Candidatus Acidoferrales bacterium]
MSLQLLPILEGGEETLVGGQAVVEGVMMRSPHAWGIAIRKPSGEITTHSETLQRPSEKRKWLGWPFIRGLATLGQAMRLGFVASKFSLNVGLESIAEEEGGKKPEISGWMMAVNLVLSIGFFIFMYKFVPLLAATGLKKHWAVLNGNFAFNLVDGVIRIALFLLFVWGISLFKDIKRIYHYHGGEHKTVFAFEDHGMPDIEQAQQYSTYHPRCGTSFLMTIMLICIFVYAAFPVQGFWAKFALRIAFLPVIASVSYELIRFSAKHGKSVFALLTKPGLWLQRITTQPPSNDQVECAIKALDLAMELEKKNGGELVIA